MFAKFCCRDFFIECRCAEPFIEYYCRGTQLNCNLNIVRQFLPSILDHISIPLVTSVEVKKGETHEARLKPDSKILFYNLNI